MRVNRVPSRAFALILTSLVLACGGGSDGDGTDSEAALPPEADTLRHTLATVTRNEGDCRDSPADEEELPCVSVEISYPDVNGGPSQALADSVRAFVLEVTTAPAGVYEEGTRSAPSADSAAALFVDGYMRVEEDMPSDFPRPWLLQREVRVVCNTPEFVSLRADESSYTGGAHGMTTARLASFDPTTGRRLRLSDWVSDSAMALAAGEKAFREQRDIPDNQSYERAGFNVFADSGFAFNDNVMRCGDMITFHYDPYEIGPYAIGPTDLEVSFTAMTTPMDSTTSSR